MPKSELVGGDRLDPMEGRWVCRRCYESNDAAADACARCGLERGADPARADAPDGPPTGAQWAPVAKQDTRPAWLRLLLRFGWVGVVVIIAVAGILFNARRDDSGQITTGGNLEIQDLQVGDCFNLKDEEADTVAQVDARRCDESHRYELFHVASMDAGDYPGEDQITAFAEQACVDAFGAFIGLAYEDSDLGVLYFTPGSDSWDHGDRSIQCAAEDPQNATLTTSLEGAAR